MEWAHAIWLAILQGATEFLPISSSGHLALFPHLFGWKDQGLAFDVAVHFGSLIAVIVYFKHDIIELIQGWSLTLRGESSEEGRLAWFIILATIPVGLAGYFGNHWIELNLRDPTTIAIATIGFGLLLWWADARGSKQKEIPALHWKDALLIGCAQVLALIPGTSRSGITITAALAAGYSGPSAARFSFLLSIPVIILAGGLKTIELMQSSEPVSWTMIVLSMLVSAVTAFICIKLFLDFIARFSLFPFVVYRVCLGVLLLLWFA